MGFCLSKIRKSSQFATTDKPIKTQASSHALYSKQIQMETPNIISQIYTILNSEQIRSTDKLALINKKLEPNAQAKCYYIAKNLAQSLSNMNEQNQNIEQARQAVVVSKIILIDTPYYKGYDSLGKKQLQGLALYIQKQKNISALDNCVTFIHKMYVNLRQKVYSNSEFLFKALVNRFIDFGTDQIRYLAVQILIKMMLDNINLTKYANEPYYFLEFWLYAMNQQTQLNKQLYWIDCVKKLYEKNKSVQDDLFYENDFKVFIDLLVRVIGSCPDGKTLRVPLECYLVLSRTKKMKPQLLRIDDIKEYIGQIDGESLGVSDIFFQIQALK